MRSSFLIDECIFVIKFTCFVVIEVIALFNCNGGYINVSLNNIIRGSFFFNSVKVIFLRKH